MLVTSVSTRNTPVSAEIAASHRSCCRSSPADRRNLWTSPPTAAIARAASPSPPTQTRTSSAPWSAGTPSGFAGWVVGVTSMTPGRNITASIRSTKHVISAPGNQRQARDGSRPVGNSSKIKGTTPATRKDQLFIQAAAVPNRSEPGFVSRVYFAYSSDAPPKSTPRPAARNSQPIGFFGTRQTSTAPTPAYVPRNATLRSVNGSPVNVWFNDARTIATTKSPPPRPSSSQTAGRAPPAGSARLARSMTSMLAPRRTAEKGVRPAGSRAGTLPPVGCWHHGRIHMVAGSDPWRRLPSVVSAERMRRHSDDDDLGGNGFFGSGGPGRGSRGPPRAGPRVRPGGAPGAAGRRSPFGRGPRQGGGPRPLPGARGRAVPRSADEHAYRAW